jgi:hypothetical protein
MYSFRGAFDRETDANAFRDGRDGTIRDDGHVDPIITTMPPVRQVLDDCITGR